MALEIVDALVRSGAFDAIALESVPQLRGDPAEDPGPDMLGRLREAELRATAPSASATSSCWTTWTARWTRQSRMGP
jgi:hypothetical protein